MLSVINWCSLGLPWDAGAACIGPSNAANARKVKKMRPTGPTCFEAVVTVGQRRFAGRRPAAKPARLQRLPLPLWRLLPAVPCGSLRLPPRTLTHGGDNRASGRWVAGLDGGPVLLLLRVRPVPCKLPCAVPTVVVGRGT